MTIDLRSTEAKPTETVADRPSNVGPTLNVSVNHVNKSEKCNGLNFKQWQQKMFFYLITLNLARFLMEKPLKLAKGGGYVQVVNALDAWRHSNFLCKNYVMNYLADSIYQPTMSCFRVFISHL